MAEFDPVQVALLIRQGQFKLEHVPEAARATVRAFLHSLRDADAGVILAARERVTKQHGRSTVKPRNALS